MKRFCKGCGNEVKGKGRFCETCGAELTEDTVIVDTAVKEKKHRKWPLVIAAILVVCIAVGGVILFSRSTTNPYKSILNAAQKTFRTSTSFKINSSDGDAYGYLEIDPNAGTVYIYMGAYDNDDDDLELNYKYGQGTIRFNGSNQPFSDSLTLMCDALLSFAKNGDTDAFYEWLPYTQAFEDSYGLYGDDVDVDKLKDAGHDLYKRLSSKDSLEQVMHYEKEVKNNITSYYFNPDVAELFVELDSAVKPLYSDKEAYNEVVADTEWHLDNFTFTDSAAFRVDSNGCLRVIDIYTAVSGSSGDFSSSYFTITFDSYDEE